MYSVRTGVSGLLGSSSSAIDTGALPVPHSVRALCVALFICSVHLLDTGTLAAHSALSTNQQNGKHTDRARSPTESRRVTRTAPLYGLDTCECALGTTHTAVKVAFPLM